MHWNRLSEVWCNICRIRCSANGIEISEKKTHRQWVATWMCFNHNEQPVVGTWSREATVLAAIFYYSLLYYTKTFLFHSVLIFSLLWRFATCLERWYFLRNIDEQISHLNLGSTPTHSSFWCRNRCRLFLYVLGHFSHANRTVSLSFPTICFGIESFSSNVCFFIRRNFASLQYSTAFSYANGFTKNYAILVYLFCIHRFYINKKVQWWTCRYSTTKKIYYYENFGLLFKQIIDFIYFIRQRSCCLVCCIK